jgi:mono/diheme cytochrome c family protein
MKRILVSAFLAALCVVGTRAEAQDETWQRGKVIAEQICSECHAITKGQPRSPNGLAPTFETVATTPGMTTIALTAALRTSHRTMPNIILSDEQLRGVIAYITSLK